MDPSPFHELDLTNRPDTHVSGIMYGPIRNQSVAQRQQEDEEAVLLIISLAILGESRPFRQLQTYLTRGDLPGNPRSDSAWAYLYSARNNRAFITTMGVNVRTFDELLSRFSIHWAAGTIPRNDVNPNGDPQVGRQSLDAVWNYSLGGVRAWRGNSQLVRG
ncbi:hypothetical protein Pst134EA_002508 [Puccinia striiformis f. sp. tritici]|nr:hypothetical protein Pst134EA_002508 [Puccinia striiformis f. sp. tritici]KAH9471875.1 hypothetical protein Pst134EA_002508 [Puccinia striiformis f. sp. tritici]